MHTSQAIMAQPSIAVEINAATKCLHSQLNKLIIERLPYGLPPHARSPARYTIGLARFAALYGAFEQELDKLATSAAQDEHHEAVRAWVVASIPQELRRSARLKNDLEHLSRLTNVNMDTRYATVEERRVHELVHAKPHVLVAYAWIMYMAIFSGGRWIRGQLADAGDDFWAAGHFEKHSADVLGFSFLSFNHGTDGEELKAAFKLSLTHADIILTPDERQDIVRASQTVFQHCINIIDDINKDVLWHEATANLYLAFMILGLGLFWLLWRSLSGQVLSPG